MLKTSFLTVIFILDINSTLNTISGNIGRTVDKRSSMQNRNSLTMTKNFTRMVIVSVFVNVIGQIPFSVCFILGYLGVNSPDYTLANTYSTFFIILVPGLDLFSYYLFNKLFRTVLNDYFKCIFCRC